MQKTIQSLWLAVSIVAAPAAFAWEVNRSFPVGDGGQLTVRTEQGSIQIETHSAREIAVAITVRGFDEDEVAFSFDHEGDDLRIEGEIDRRRYNNQSIRYSITVPENYNLDLSTAGGSIEVEDLTGEVDVRTSGGSLAFYNITGPINGNTSGGSIELETVKGRVDVRTSGGSIKVDTVDGNVRADTSGGSLTMLDISGDLEAETSGGSIGIENVSGRVDASTSGGSIRASFAMQPAEAVSLNTSGGSVTVEIPGDSNVTLNARGYKVKTDIPVNGRTSAERRLSGDINAGGAELNLSTSAGSVYIETAGRF